MATPPRKTPAAKPAVAKTTKPAKKTAPTKAVAAPVAKPTAPRAKPKVEKTDKTKKPKMVRDSFTCPKTEYVVLDALKQRAVKLSHPIKKGELLRAGIKALIAMPNAAFLQALQAVPPIKTGRPKKT